eukprot:1348690-Amorphochlora_amoeboformis.AAC.2
MSRENQRLISRYSDFGSRIRSPCVTIRQVPGSMGPPQARAQRYYRSLDGTPDLPDAHKK